MYNSNYFPQFNNKHKSVLNPKLWWCITDMALGAIVAISEFSRISLFGLPFYILPVYTCKIQNIKTTLASDLLFEFNLRKFGIRYFMLIYKIVSDNFFQSISYCFWNIWLQTLKKIKKLKNYKKRQISRMRHGKC